MEGVDRRNRERERKEGRKKGKEEDVAGRQKEKRELKKEGRSLYCVPERQELKITRVDPNQHAFSILSPSPILQIRNWGEKNPMVNKLVGERQRL